MDVAVVGGGPGGSYFALTLKKRRPDWNVTAYERSPKSVTYGWGVVLPEKAYAKLRDVDQPTCERIERRNAEWDPIDTIHRGERVRCDGYPYTSILRTDLLEILQSRCEELDVEMRFETAVDDVAALASSADLVVGADGIHSRVRETFVEEFGTSSEEGDNLFSWFGTDQSFEALTHVYARNDDGLWHAGAYPGSTSTFVITCDPETWRAAGIDRMAEPEYVSYFEDAFADALGGHGLRSKKDSWRPFRTVRNETWFHENVVLLGDAAHTAHFTIGSGTRMAIDDAIALATALDDCGGDVPEALSRYQSERKPHVDALQQAAELSRRHFESIEREAHLEPVPFATRYLTRTGHTTYESLRKRDQSFVDAVDAWFASDASGGSSGTDNPDPPLEQPITIVDRTVPNRVIVRTEPSTTPSGERGSDPESASESCSLPSPGLFFATVPVTNGIEDTPETLVEAVQRGKNLFEWFGHEEGLFGVNLRIHHSDRQAGGTDRSRAELASVVRTLEAEGVDALVIERTTETASTTSGREPARRKSELASAVGHVAAEWPEARPLLAAVSTDPTSRGEETHIECAEWAVSTGADGLFLGRNGEDSPDTVRLGEDAKRLRSALEVPVLVELPEASSDAVNTELISGRADLCAIPFGSDTKND